MRRKDREITEKEKLLEILDHAEVCRLAITADPAPYIVPLNFSFIWDNDLELYFHSAFEGRKIDLLSNNNHVGFELDTGHTLVTGEKPCDWSMNYKSIIGTGIVEFLESEADQIKALNCIMGKYGFTGKPDYQKEMFAEMKFFKLVVQEMTGKART